MSVYQKDDINLLIVDDSKDNLMALETSLEQDGLKIYTTASPKSAMEICLENDISIALIDVKMPEMDGFELLDLIKKNPLTEHIMVILITGYSMSSACVVKGLNKGAVDYLFKPLDLYITIAKVNSLITMVNYQREINNKNKELVSYQHDLVEAIEQTEKSKIVKENFLANMSHEIRTPLNAIIGLTSLLTASEVTRDQQEMIDMMDFSSKSLLGIVNDILESAQIDAGKIVIKREPADIAGLVQSVCNLTRPMANEKGLELICETDANIPSLVMADPLRLNQILINLINNAIKFTQAGTIKISLQLLEKRGDDVVLEFIVKDSGVGIPQSSINKIFTRFEQIEDKTWQKFGGTGLGLSIVKRLVELKGGKLKVESTLGAGTSFIFTNSYKDVTKVKALEITKKQIADLPKFDNILILLAEDNAINQFVAVKILKKWNIKVDIAINGLDAFKKLKENNYSLILMDTHMPVMDGNEATRKIRTELTGFKKDIPIMSFSASVLEIDRNDAKKAGANDFIEKPFELKTLNRKLHKLLDKQLANQEVLADQF
ncbi:response regulator [Mucilaginibacter gotjawali]|uniref:histidine kinase n=1 Tax=Mucilaginibacter gotjawali TaxID=1550579 RepID=A0A839SIP9_9SPHI|nr:response regulator [Mucilaginibacter gotjawali]MBB3057154.1 signal transduction histidine kinase [Mucilaginibacter gotjawali]